MFNKRETIGLMVVTGLLVSYIAWNSPKYAIKEAAIVGIATPIAYTLCKGQDYTS